MSRNCDQKPRDRSKSPGKKKKDEHAGMFFNGYKWEPIEGLAPASVPGMTLGGIPNGMGSVQALLQEQAALHAQHQE
jgi:hypothetical protein